jgi:hypothetical protein
MNRVHKVKVAALTQREVKAMIKSSVTSNMELNYARAAATTQPVSNTGTVWALTQNIIVGDTFNQRSGIQISQKTLDMAIQVFINSTSTVDTQAVRFILFRDTLNTGSLPTVSEVLVNPSVISHYTPAVTESNRFKVLYDQAHALARIGGTPPTKIIHFNRKVNSKITYNGATDTAASNGKNALFMLVVGDQSVDLPLYSFEMLTRYYDA